MNTKYRLKPLGKGDDETDDFQEVRNTMFRNKEISVANYLKSHEKLKTELSFENVAFSCPSCESHHG